MKQFDGVVISVREIAPRMSLLWLAVPPEAASAKAGQFYMVRCGDHFDPLLRRPIAYHRARFAVPPFAELHDGRLGPNGAESLPGGGFSSELDLKQLPSPFAAIALLVATVGRGTSWLAARRRGDLIDLLGPMGSGYVVEPGSRNILLVAGGMGMAPMVALAEEAVGRGLSVTLLQGVATAEQAYPADLLPHEVELVLATEDGSAGTEGLVTDLLSSNLGWADQVFACGPRAMYVTMSSILSRSGSKKSVQVSIEERMACGLGACLGCSVKTKRDIKTACKDGPVFELKELVW